MSLSGIVSSALQTVTSPLTGLASGATNALASAGLNAIGSWVLSGTESALRTVAQVIGSATAPNLESTWFGSAYWRVAGMAALLTLPFMLAAAVQALVRSDLALLFRSAFVYLPLSLVGVGLAAPVTMLLLAATDEMSTVVSGVGVEGGAKFLDSAAGAAAAYSAVGGSPFYAVVVGVLALMAALALAVEMLIREAAVYVVVLMLPLGFAAMVWPARRIWATRLIELLVSLILSKFVIVAVLSLAGSAFANGTTPGISKLLVAMTLVVLSVFAPWTLMRVLPFTEVAAGAAGALRRELPIPSYQEAAKASVGMVDPALGLAAKLARSATGAGAESGSPEASGDGDAQAPLDGFPTGRASVGGAVRTSGAGADTFPEFDHQADYAGAVFDQQRLGTGVGPAVTSGEPMGAQASASVGPDQTEPTDGEATVLPTALGETSRADTALDVTSGADTSEVSPTGAGTTGASAPRENRLEGIGQAFQQSWKWPRLDTALVRDGLEFTGPLAGTPASPEPPSVESRLPGDAARGIGHGPADGAGEIS